MIKLPEETKRKIKEAMLGKHHTEKSKGKMRNYTKAHPEHHFVKGQIPWNKGMSNLNWKGKDNPNWKGGITPLVVAIRKLLEYKQWREAVFERDNYICQDCGICSEKENRVYLNAHHRKAFYIILAEFLQEYNQFSPYEDRDTLVRLAMKWQPFWDISKGETLCEDCHNKTKNERWR